MKISLTSKYMLHLRLPLRLTGPAHYELTFALAELAPIDRLKIPLGYTLSEYNSNKDRGALMSLHNRCGFNFNDDAFDAALSYCIPGGIKLVRHISSGQIVSSMMARHLSTPEFWFGGQIGWLATDVAHRGRGLGRLSAALATNHLINRGYNNIWVTTQPQRIDAIRIFTSLGYQPTERAKREYDWPFIEKTMQLRRIEISNS